MFSRLSVLLSVKAGYLKKFWTDSTKFGGQVELVTRMNLLDFGEDPDSDPDTRIF